MHTFRPAVVLMVFALLSGVAAKAQTVTANNDYFTTMANSPLMLPVLANDFSETGYFGEVLITNPPASGGNAAPLPNGMVAYVSPPGFTGTDEFSYSVSNDLGDVSTAAVVVDVLEGCPDFFAVMNPTQPISCNGLCNGQLTVAVWGGVPPYTFLWSVGMATEPVFGNLCAGWYSCTVTDFNDCITVVNHFLNQPPPLVVQLTANPPLVAPGETAQLNATVSGGVAPYNFSWSMNAGLVGPVAINNPPGPYSVTVTDANGCTAQDNVFVNGGPPLAAPVAVDDFFEIPPGPPLGTLNVLLNDTLSSPVTLTVSEAPNHGMATVTGTFIQYQPNPGYSGPDAFTYTICNPAGNCDQATVTLMVLPGGPGCDFVISLNPMFPTCSGTGCDGSIGAFVTGGMPPYTYFWTGPDGFTSIANPITGLCPGYYNLAVTDASGCTQNAGAALVLPPLTATITATSMQLAPGETSELTAFATGGAFPVFFQWSTGETGNTIVVNMPGNYCVIAVDANGCTDEFCVNITPEMPPVPYTAAPDTVYAEAGQPVLVAPLLNDTGTPPLNLLTAVASGLPLSIDYPNDWISFTAPNLPDTIYISYSATGSAMPGATGTIVVIVLPEGECGFNCVWPGDADNNGTANNFDVLNIGLGYEFTGAPRSDTSTDWYAHNATDWASVFPDGLNHKFADCNGNGIINAADTTAISANYGLTHDKTTQTGSSGVPLYFTLENQSGTEVGDTISLSVHLGDADNPVSDFYGIAYTVNFDGTFLQLQNFTPPILPWAGTISNTLHFRKNVGNSQSDIALTRTNHQNITGQGPIGQATFVIIENIDGKNEAQFSAELPFSFSNTRCVSSNGAEIELSTQELVLSVTSSPGNTLPEEIAATVYPNPANNFLNLQLPDAAKVQIADLSGQVVYLSNLPEGTQAIDTQQLVNGLYLISVSYAAKTETFKLLIYH
ncbi:T9SS C-terminal target domain-containing protein [Sphingobacteriales bacterium UPWRP_1]|nr:hypothetical protein B6N25_17160 [Sphingobacteriales bacterium TSM_CSS]PSJ73261.1 T9SS C-terminal target domain-containing protein [Sphingobacteriales bacterium UPWRP_1]